MTTDSDMTREDDRDVQLYTTYKNVNTNRAIADAKTRYEEDFDVPRYELTARKFGSGVDREKGETYTTIAVAVRHDAPDDIKP